MMKDLRKTGSLAAVFVASVCTMGGCVGSSLSEPATLAVTNARVWTGNPAQPWAEAVACRSGRIIAVGSNDEIQTLIGEETTVVSEPGAMVVPGFIDSHVHFVSGGSALASVQLRDAGTPEEFARRIAEYAATLAPGEWILYGAWDHENWGGTLPTRQLIDEITPDNPVWIFRLDGHMALANSLAFELAGIDRNTADVEGGTIVRDVNGEPTGILKDNALGLVTSVVPAPGEAQMDRALRAASQHVASKGVTTVHDMAQEWHSLATYRRARDKGTLGVRVYAVTPLHEWERLRDEVTAGGRGDEWLRIGGLKGFMDGSLGSHTAAFLDPFTDAPQDRGLLVNDLSDIEAWVSGADEAGLQVIVHAIGDRAIRNLLDIYAGVVQRHGDRDRRFRIEHAQHIHPDDVSRFAAQRIIASMQPYHAIDDGRWAEKVIGHKRAQTTYAFRSLLDSGARVAFGSDWNVAPPTPLEGLYAAVTRRTLDDANPDGWIPEQKITVEEALRAYTVEAAYASFEEDLKGSIEVGKLADLVVLDRDITAIPGSEIRQVHVLYTVVGGAFVFRASVGHQLPTGKRQPAN